MRSTAPLSTASEPPAPPAEAGLEPVAAPSLEDQKRAFLRLVSHELRTPLNSILGFSELLAGEHFGPLGAPQYREYAGIIRTSGKRLLKLMNQVLEIGRLEGLRLEPGPEAVEPALDETVRGLAAEAAAKSVRLKMVCEGAPLALADPWGLRTALSHLVQNAIQFSPEGGEVRLRVAVGEPFVDIFIEDDGEGCDPAEIARLVRPFEQGENALTRRGEGAGLGLTIAELTCGAMGARLTLKTAPGRGMSARIRLPAA